jgi:hypothetical protein
LTEAKITVFPVPVSRKAEAEEADPTRLQAELERLRAENVVLRTRLAAVEAIALEREGTIDDLRHALQMLPSAWAEQLEERGDLPAEEADLAPAPLSSTPERVDTEDAEALFAEVAALRVRLERKRLEAEQDILRQERERLRQERERAHGWRRSRRASPTSG